MTISPNAAEVRSLVRRTFVELGVDLVTLADLDETVMIDEGHTRARSYRVSNLMAMWLIDVGLLQFYDDEGNMLQRTNLLMEIEPVERRVAA